jgi:hypothetical protein
MKLCMNLDQYNFQHLNNNQTFFWNFQFELLSIGRSKSTIETTFIVTRFEGKNFYINYSKFNIF